MSRVRAGRASVAKSSSFEESRPSRRSRTAPPTRYSSCPAAENRSPSSTATGSTSSLAPGGPGVFEGAISPSSIPGRPLGPASTGRRSGAHTRDPFGRIGHREVTKGSEEVNHDAGQLQDEPRRGGPQG